MKDKQNHKITKVTLQQKNNCMEEPFNLDELTNAIKKMKSGKAAGLDDIRTEQLKNFGLWFLRFYNECTKQMWIPKTWHEFQIIVILKPGKSPNGTKNFRLAALLCHI